MAAADSDRIRREDLQGTYGLEAERDLDQEPDREREERILAHGLSSAESVRNRKISLFQRGRWQYNTGTFMNSTFLEDMNDLDSQDAVIIGAGYDGGVTYRPGTRFGPQAMRRISPQASGYNVGLAVDFQRAINIVDAGDVNVIHANLEKSFDQIAKAVSFAAEREVLPVILGGDHAIGYPNLRGIAPFIDGNIGIIHFDRHQDISEYTLDERMHGSPFFHATNIPNAPATNLVQIGIGGWQGSQDGVRNARDRNATVITVDDVERFGPDRVIEYALEVAWKNAKAVWISFDVDSLDPAYTPGTGTPVPGGLTPREALKMVHKIAAEGVVGMEVVEVSPPYDWQDQTALFGVYCILEVLGSMIINRKIGNFKGTKWEPPDRPE